MRWDVYIWPIRDAFMVRCVAKNISHDEAMAICDKYLIGQTYDTYMVPAGTKLYM